MECDYEHSTCPDRLHNPSPAFCIGHGKGTGPQFINGEEVYQHMFDMTDRMARFLWPELINIF